MAYERLGLTDLKPAQAWHLTAALFLAWLAMVAPLVLQAMLRSGHFIASVAAIRLVFEVSYWGCWGVLSIPGYTGYTAYKRPNLLLTVTIFVALVGILLHLTATVAVHHAG